MGSLGLIWLKIKLAKTFWVQDALWNDFLKRHKNKLIEFLNGRYLDKVSGVPMIGIYMFKKKSPYLPLMHLNNMEQAEFYMLAIYDEYTNLEEAHREQGILFLFRQDTDDKNSDSATEIKDADVSIEDLSTYGAMYTQFHLCDISLECLNVSINWVFRPTISFQEHISGIIDSKVIQSSMNEGRKTGSYNFIKKDVLMTHLLRFEQALTNTIQKLSGGISLDVPPALVEGLKQDKELKETFMASLLENTCNGWLGQLQDTLNLLNELYTEGSTPMRELSYWRDRYTALDMVYKQIKSPSVDQFITIYNKRTGLMTPSISLLETLLKEAKENNRFLSTCERHFKNIEMGTNYRVVIESIVPLMKSLRLIWMISKHYNDDEKMMSLMEKVAKVLIERVRRVNNLQTLFRNPPSRIKKRMSDASELLKLWKQAYLETRHFIETSGRGTRWEFDRKRLFLLTDYMAEVCQNIGDSVELIDEVNHLYELSLFAVTMKQPHVAEMKKNVNDLLLTFNLVTFDPYDPANERLWLLKMDVFQKKLSDIEIKSQLYIQNAFRNIRSPNMGIELLKNLRNVLVKSSLVKTLNEKIKDISFSFLNQVEKTSRDFIDNSLNPPLFKGQPPVSGAIHWQRFMLSTLRNSLHILLTENDFMVLEYAEKLKESLTMFCRETKNYSSNKYQVWVEKSAGEVEQLLKAPIFILPNQKELEFKGTRQIQAKQASSYKDSAYFSRGNRIKSFKSIHRSSKVKEGHQFTKSVKNVISDWPKSSILGSKNMSTDFNSKSNKSNNSNNNVNDVTEMQDPNKNRNNQQEVSVIKSNLFNPKSKNKTSPISKKSITEIGSKSNSHKSQDLQSYLSSRKTNVKSLPSHSQRRFSGSNIKTKAIPTLTVMNESVKETSFSVEGDIIKENLLEVNLNPYLFEIILEAKHLEAIGYVLPEALKKAVLLEQSYRDKMLILTAFVNQYNNELEKLNKVDFMVLEEYIKNLFRIVHSGTKRINWRTACIVEFIDLCRNTLEEFVSIASQYKKDVSRIEARLEEIQKAVFFSGDTFHNVGVVMDCKEYFESEKIYRDELVEKLTKEYENITSIIRHISFVIWKTTSGKCSKMKQFFVYYENRIYNSLTEMVIENLKIFIDLLNHSKNLFQIYGVLYYPYLNLNPSQTNVMKYITQCALDCVFTTKRFPRWLDGSANPVASKKDEEEYYSYSFLNDIALNPEIITLLKKVQTIAETMLNKANDSLLPWTRFEVIWQSDKEAMVQDWIEKTNPRATDYDDALYSLKVQLSEIEKKNELIEIDSIKLNLKPLITSVLQHYLHLFDIYIHELHIEAKSSLVAFKNDCSKKLEEMSFKPQSIDHLKTVLHLLNEISNSEIERNLTVKELKEKYDVLEIYEVQLSDQETVVLQRIDVLKKFLTDQARLCNRKLTLVKKKFAEIAHKEAKEFYQSLDAFVANYEANGPHLSDDLEAGLTNLRNVTIEANRLEAKRQDIINSQKLFDLSINSSSPFVKVLKSINETDLVYKIFKNYQTDRSEWELTQWSELNVQLLQKGIDGFLLQMKKLPSHLKELKASQTLREVLVSFKNNLPIIVELKNEALRERHWQSLFSLTNINMDVSDLNNISLKNIFAMNLDNYRDIVTDIIINAMREANIEKSIKEVDGIWNTLKFTLGKYLKNGADKGYVLGSVEDINLILDDHIMQLQGMSASRNIGPFLEAVQLLEKQLSSIGEIITLWVNAQRKWLYLDSIFVMSDIKIQLPEEARLFDRLDKIYVSIMQSTHKDPLVKGTCLQPGLLVTFQELIYGLDKCQKSLIEYLDSKRNIFPRFYFISDDELLSVIGSSDPNSIQEHIIKIFDNISSLMFSQTSQTEIIGMMSAEGETMKFKTKTMAEGKVEIWMNSVLTAMQKSNRIITKEAIFYYGANGVPRINWMLNYQGMVALVGDQVWWTWEVEDVFMKIAKGNKQAMKSYYKKLLGQLDDLVVMVRKPLESNVRKKLNTILIIDVHARDIIESFVRDSISTANDFQWESQLRFYWVRRFDRLMVQQCSGWFSFGHEYMGLNGRLVITPLTDRIYLTITQALSLKLGGAPAGPAGTGKTETTKDLAKALGLLCVVTNCGEGMDYKAIGKIFSGLCQCGCWGCFDEFNRIEISVLSVVSSQIQTIRNALMLNLQSFYFEGEMIHLDSKMGIFITMNPGYAGRTELPESIKALFRPVVCIVPDSQMICEIMLFSEGFLMAKVLAKKMTVLYKLAIEQLSKQYHYDFQLRAIKAVLVMAGELKRTSDADEDVTLMRSLRDMNLPKFVFEDVPLFLGLINDLFPGLSCPRVQYPDYNQAIEQTLQENNYVLLPHQVDKVVQLYETMLTRHTTMVVGPTCGGKSVVINTLASAQTKLGIPTKLFIMNPKERSVIELYGWLDTVSRDWTDGLLSNIFREINKPTDKVERKYIVFDGDVDALWVENMNSVMDDNKLLTLANGERIRLQKHCALLFEVSDLQYAQPSTVSRCGMVYVDPKNLKYEPYWVKWLNERFMVKQNDEEHDNLQKLYEKYIPDCIDLIFEGKLKKEKKDPLKSIIPLNSLSLVKQLTCVLDALLVEESLDIDILECNFIEAIYWSLGAVLLENDRIIFDDFIKEISGMYQVEGDMVKSVNLPGGKMTVYDYVFDKTENMWVKWSLKIPEYIHDYKLKFYEILVPTQTTVSLKWALDLFLSRETPVLLSGESGTSKTVTVNNFLRSLKPDDFQLLFINFSSRTSSLDCQRNIENNTEKRTRDTYGPPMRKKLVVFVDDLNMPQIDLYGTQQPIAMLKQLIGYSGLYDRGQQLNWKNFKDLDWVASMGNPGGGRNNVDPRFISLFSFIYVVFPTERSIFHIYNSISKSFVKDFTEEITTFITTITSMSMELFKCIVRDLPPTPSKFHYIFSLRDLSRLFCGLSLMHPEKIMTKCDLVRLWRHECLRVFTDKLTNHKDYKVVNSKIQSLIETHANDCVSEATQEPILYGDFRTYMYDVPRLIYEDLENFEEIKKILVEILEEYENSFGKASLVLFEDAIAHLCRIYRIIKLPQGHCLLTGQENVGKTSLAKIATFMAGYEFFTIELSRGYNEMNLRDDLKILYEKVCMQNKQVTFVFKDQHIIEENFLELINNMLTLGVVPALYADDEKEKIISHLHKEFAGEKLTKEMLWLKFAQKAINNLHIVLNMNASNPNLSKRCRNFPGLVNNTHIDWFFEWPQQALYAVASSIIKVDEEYITSEMHQTIVEHCVFVHTNIYSVVKDFYEQLRRKIYISPINYLDFLQSFLKLVAEQHTYILNQCNRLSEGMKKLIDSAVQVDSLSEKLEVQQQAVAVKTQECSVLLEKISKATAEAEQKQSLALAKSSQIEIQKVDITREKNEATQALSKAMPALEAAKHALDYIDKNDVTEIRSFTKPPLPVQTIGECIVVLKGIKDVSWKSAKGLMTDPNFLKNLKEMDADNIPMKSIHIVKFYLKQMNVTLEEMKEKSKAGAGLMKFVQAVVEYCEVFKEVKPKKEKVERLEKEYNLTMQEFDKINSQLISIQATLDDLKLKYEKAVLVKRNLEEETEIMERRLNAADRLIKGLSSERIRWQAELEDLGEQKRFIVGDCLLCAAFLSYASPFTWLFREELIYKIWKNNLVNLDIKFRLNFSIATVMTNDVEISKWTSEGLPHDELSIQNAILVTKASRFPLCIDPQQQALNWIKQKEKNLKTSSFNNPDYMKNLQLAVKYGAPFLFQEVDDYLDPLLNNVLSKNYDKSTGTVMMGDKRIDFDNNFRLYLTTKLPNPNYTSDFYSLTMVINFMVTMKGLEEQLLGVIVKIEKNELEERREQLIHETSSNKIFLNELEDILLKELAQSTGNVLDNVYLLNTLESTKEKSSEVSEKLKQAVLTTEEIDKNRDIYRPIAKLGALLFFVLADLSNINEMYQYSLSGYIKVFEMSLRKSFPDIRLDRRLKNISNSLLSSVYTYGCTGIFEKHKLLFSMQMVVKLQLDKGSITDRELSFLTKGKISLEKSEQVNPFDWIPITSWENITALQDVLPQKCSNLIEDLRLNELVWKEWFEHDSPESINFPMNYSNSLTEFQKLLFLRAFRLDRIYLAISNFIKENMGQEFIMPPITSISNIYDQSSPSVPIIFILSTGFDSTSDLLKFADEIDVKSASVKILSLGQGQEKTALNLLSTAMLHGHWLILQNCHLLLKFMKDFEKEFESYSKPHPHFRLWLTTEPVQAFPISILQRCFKVVTEPPIGLKNNLQRIYFKMVPPVLEKECTHYYYPVLVYVLSFFHAVVQERRKYGKIGWNIKYDFNDSDFSVCLNIIQLSLQKIINTNNPVPWISLKYMVGQVMYGGRVIDDFDRRTIATYMDEYMGEFLLDPFQKFHFFQNNDTIYTLPKATLKEEFVAHMEKMSANTSPMVLGMNDNAEISYYLNAGQSILNYMNKLQPKSKEKEASGSKEEVVDKTAKDILTKMPSKFIVEKVREHHASNITPSIVVLLQELERFNKLTEKMIVSLSVLRRGLAGEVGMDNELEEISASLYAGSIPKSWKRLAPDTKKSLPAWITHFLERWKQYNDWAFIMEPEVMWISGLHIPGSYITALVQIACRKNGWALEKSTLYTRVSVETNSTEDLERITEGKSISGFYLEGAGWDVKKCCLKKQEPKKLWTMMPNIKIVPILRTKLRLANTLRTPVYMTSDRRNAMGVGLVFEADLPTTRHLSHWILQGVCLVLNPE